MDDICGYCKKTLHLGSGQISGDRQECLGGHGKGMQWRNGFAIWNNLTDHRGVKHELAACDLDVQIEIVETMGGLRRKHRSNWREIRGETFIEGNADYE